MARQAILRDHRSEDASDLSRIAVAAFAQHASRYSDRAAMRAGIAATARLAEAGEPIVAGCAGRVVGGVAYLPAGSPRAEYLGQSWAIVRNLVVAPGARRRGPGRLLTEGCVRRARRDGVPVPAVALHTSPIMEVALPMYLRMGSRFLRDAPPIHGVPRAVYLRQGVSAPV